MPFDNLPSQLATDKFGFPVELEKVFLADGTQVPDAQAVVRKDNGAVLAVHGNRYQLWPHQEIFDGVNRTLVEGGFLDSDIAVKDYICNGGAVVSREIIFPGRAFNVGGHAMEFRIVARNSYDGNFAYSMFAGAHRPTCANMSILPSGLGVGSSLKHTSWFNEDVEAAKLHKAFDAFLDSEGVWQMWHQSRCNRDQARDLFSRTLCHAPTRGEPDRVNKTMLNALMLNYDTQGAAGMGPSLWNAYNAATAWATHTKAASHAKDAHVVRMRREEAVDKMVQSRAFKTLVATN